MANADWMHTHSDIIRDYTLNDLCIPGTHDTLTYDLTPTFSENDVIPFLRGAETLKRLSTANSERASDFAAPVAPAKPSPAETDKLYAQWLVNAARTQTLPIQTQFEAGMRMFDIRMTFSRGRWIGTHALETKLTIDVYLRALVAVMQQHRGEVCVVWISRHGLSGLEKGSLLSQVPNAHAGWLIAKDAMSPLLVDNEAMPFGTTTIGELVRRNKRIYAFVDGFEDVTLKDKHAVNSMFVRNLTFVSGNATNMAGNRSNLLKLINNPSNATTYTGVGLNGSIDAVVLSPMGISRLNTHGFNSSLFKLILNVSLL